MVHGSDLYTPSFKIHKIDKIDTMKHITGPSNYYQLKHQDNKEKIKKVPSINTNEHIVN